MPAICAYYRPPHSGILSEMEMLFTVENVGLKPKCLGLPVPFMAEKLLTAVPRAGVVAKADVRVGSTGGLP